MSLREAEPPEGGVTCGVAVTEQPPSGRKAGGSGSYLCGAGRGFSRRGLCAQRGSGGTQGPGAMAGSGGSLRPKWELRSWQGRRAHIGSHPEGYTLGLPPHLPGHHTRVHSEDRVCLP